MEEHSDKKPIKKIKVSKSNVAYVGFVMAWALLSTIAEQFIVAQILVLILGSKINQPGWMMLYYLLSYAVTIALVILIPPRLVKMYEKQHSKKKQSKPTTSALATELTTTPTDLGVQKFPTFVDIGLAPVGYVVYIFFARIITSIMSGMFSWFDIEQDQNVGFNYFSSNADQVFAMLSVVFIAPIAEEIIMRGWLYGKVRRKIKKVPLAIFLVSLLFAVLHGQWNVGVTVFVLSCVLCSLREVTGTIWAGMLLHILSNGIAFYLVYIVGI